MRNLKQSSYGVGRREFHKEPPSLGFMDFPKGPCSPIEYYAKNRKSIFQNRNLLGGIKKVELPTEPPQTQQLYTEPNLAGKSVRKKNYDKNGKSIFQNRGVSRRKLLRLNTKRGGAKWLDSIAFSQILTLTI